jgi:histidinol-phosphatase
VTTGPGDPAGADAADLRLALELADLADSITRKRFLAADLRVDTKPDMTPVSEADTAVEQAIRARLASARPDDAVLGEEFGPSAGAGAPGCAGSRRWIIDPIDATKNYVRGIPVWATLIALQERSEAGERTTVGVASAPALGRRWWASEGAGAFVDDGRMEPRRLAVSAVGELADAQLLVSGPEEWGSEPEGRGTRERLDTVLTLVRRCWRTRAFGDFWQYMLVAEGAAEIAFEPAVALWDLAAPQVIVEQAGGRFTDLAGLATADGGDALASNGLVHEAALAIVGR